MAIWRVPLGLIVAGIGLFVISTAIKAMAVAFDGNDFPEALAIKLEALPVIFPVHMLTGGLSLLLVPLAIFMRRTRWHKWFGRVAAADVVVAGVTSIPVALTYPVTPMAGAGFAMQGIVWMALLGAGIFYIKRDRVAQHRAAMLMMAAVTSGAVFFRVYLALWAIYGSRRHFDTFYACDAWMGWLIPLAGVGVYLWLGRRRRTKSTYSLHGRA